ncbi:hypothetical protein E2C01_100106 [Portunus trituberculatus]|uniref:Uncharacterized protein n=1 Tax=Portunus trituberculatus TaxID=210409 RepID=A0A5B7KB73_PORTR|nr:hypothetical protein [Portunus trituberculatus]
MELRELIQQKLRLGGRGNEQQESLYTAVKETHYVSPLSVSCFAELLMTPLAIKQEEAGWLGEGKENGKGKMERRNRSDEKRWKGEK